jgi:hypothetical protein
MTQYWEEHGKIGPQDLRPTNDCNHYCARAGIADAAGGAVRARK